jgi:hypothetical protein
MTKTLLTMALTALLSTSVLASGGVEVQAGYEQGKLAAGSSAAVVIRPFVDVGSGYSVALRSVSQRYVSNGAMVSFIEPQVSKTVLDGNAVYGVTGGLGVVSGSVGSYGYYTVEPKVGYIINNKLTVGASIRYRDLIDSSAAPFKMQSFTYNVAAYYEAAKGTTVGLIGYEKNLDEKATGALLSVTQAF